MTARIQPYHRPSDCIGDPHERSAVADLFAHLFAGRDDPHFDGNHDGMAIAARSPALAGQLARLGGVVIGQLGWSQRVLLRELAAQAVNAQFNSRYSFESRRGIGESAGLSELQLEALASGEAPAELFDAEQRLVIDYARATAKGHVSDALFKRMVAHFGEAETVEATAVIGFFGFWAMFLNATRP
ncbi:MAG: hypothetical protein KGM17_10560 [Sphingomonadales bacterium]|nr:hypothetical protein [Sphingomonadales bacterium]